MLQFRQCQLFQVSSKTNIVKRSFLLEIFADIPGEGIPALSTIPKSYFTDGEGDVSACALTDLSDVVPGLVTKLLDRKEYKTNPRAIQAIKEEGQGLQEAGTWDLSSVREREDLIAWSKETGTEIVLGDIMAICSIKFHEMAEEFWKWKGRLVFRGDNAKDADGNLAVYQSLSANPTSIASAASNLAYGQIPGHSTSQADAIKAYIQAELKHKNTWVSLPRELWPASWIAKGMKRPMVRLCRALYGHPEAAGLWERHLTQAVEQCGGEELKAEHPSSFWIKDLGLLLTAYVDDLLLSGPTQNIPKFWARLRKLVSIEDPAPLGRFLGREHPEVIMPNGVKGKCYDMEDYCQQFVDKYLDIVGPVKLKEASTPFCPDAQLVASDYEVKGHLAPNACGVLMKGLWLARLARPDLLRPITELAAHLTDWSVNHDRMLHRLVCYAKSTLDLRLCMYVGDPPKDLSLRLYADADFAGCNTTAKSTTGGYLCLVGPKTFYPLAWISKRQTSVSRSTTEAEVVALAHCTFSETLPTLSLWEKMLNRDVQVAYKEDNQATIKVVEAGFSQKLRHVLRTHKVNIASLNEVIEGSPSASIDYIDTKEQAADIFTKALEPLKWPNALNLLGMMKKSLLRFVNPG